MLFCVKCGIESHSLDLTPRHQGDGEDTGTLPHTYGYTMNTLDSYPFFVNRGVSNDRVHRTLQQVHPLQENYVEPNCISFAHVARCEEGMLSQPLYVATDCYGGYSITYLQALSDSCTCLDILANLAK
jgi:hypothetical protein